MDVTSDEIRSSRFQGTRHVYDRREVDAFLHRAASTLEVYERKLAVTESHVESLEKALDLANSRVRSVRERDARISELETALAAAQHNYELEVDRTESEVSAPAAVDESHDELLEESRSRAAEIIEQARRDSEDIRSRAAAFAEESSAEAVALTEAAESAAEALLADVKRREATILEELEVARGEAEAILEAEIASKRIPSEAAMAAGSEPGVDEVQPEMAAKLERAENRAQEIATKSQQIIQQSEDRAQAAEAERDEAKQELESAAAAAQAQRAQILADVETMVGEAVTQARADRDGMLQEAQAKLEAAEGEREALLELAKTQATEVTAAAEQELESLRRQAAHLRTALSDLHGRFVDVGNVTAEDFELATALVDLDLRDVSEIVDLTVEAEEPPAVDPHQEPLPQVKSKWAHPASVAPRGLDLNDDAPDAVTHSEYPQADETGATSSNGEAHETWRDKVASQGEEQPEPDEVKESLGFYERRLAGLRARLQDAMPDDI